MKDYEETTASLAMKDYEETTAFLGQWGRFQQTMFFLLCASTVPNGLSAFSVIFLADTPRHHCLVPDVNLTAEWRKAIIPVEVVNGQEEQSRCHRYRLDEVRKLSALGYIPGRDVNLTELRQESCVDGWSYSQDIYQSTIVTEFDLVCSNQWKQPFTSSVYYLGVLCGSFFSGQISDRFGRKPVMFATTAVQTLFSFVQVFSPSWTVFSILFFIVALGQNSNHITAFVLGTEILTGNVRVLFLSLGMNLFFAVGYMMLPLFAYFIRDWKYLLPALALPGLLYMSLWWFIPESPRWLISQGRIEEAEAVLREAAKKNNVEAPQVILEGYDSDMANDRCDPEERHNILDLLRFTNIRNATLILFLVWFSINSGFFGLSLNTSSLHGDRFLNCFISAAVEVPASVSSWLALQCLPRRLSVAICLVLGGGMLYCIQLVPQGLPDLSIVLEMLGKLGISTSFQLIFAYTGELYPTPIRNTGLGTCATVAKVGGILAPYLMQLSIYYRNLPYLLLGSLALLSALATLFLPETFGRPLPETIEQMPVRERIKCACFVNTEDETPSVHQQYRQNSTKC